MQSFYTKYNSQPRFEVVEHEYDDFWAGEEKPLLKRGELALSEDTKRGTIMELGAAGTWAPLKEKAEGETIGYLSILVQDTPKDRKVAPLIWKGTIFKDRAIFPGKIPYVTLEQELRKFDLFLEERNV